MYYIFIFWFSLVSLYGSNDDFISKDEYAKMLYYNPRGIGCHLCHGDNGEGKILGTYLNKKSQTKQMVVPSINNMSYKQFKSVFTKKRSKNIVMPTYFLTTDEIQTLYYYLQKQNR